MGKHLVKTEIPYMPEVPSDWEIKRIRHVTDFVYRGITPDYTDDESMPRVVNQATFSQGKWDISKVRYTNTHLSGCRGRLKKNDVLIASTGGGILGKTFHYTEDDDNYIADGHVTIMRPNSKLTAKYLYYFLYNSYDMINDLLAKGSTNQTELQRDLLLKLYMPIPRVKEQERICRYLDYKLNKIDNVINTLDKEIEVLELAKKAIISEMVTGNVEDALLKDSGDMFCGMISKSFVCRKLRFLIKEKLKYGANETGDSDLENCPRYIRITDITSDNRLKEDGKQYLPKDLAKPFLLKNGDVLFARSGATVGKTFYYEEKYGEAAFAGYLIKAVADETKILSKYIWYYTLSNNYELWKDNVFTQTTIQNIGADKYALLPITFPLDIAEQQRIVEYLDKKCGAIDRILDAKRVQIQKLEIHKQSMIYDYVTGVKRLEEDA